MDALGEIFSTLSRNKLRTALTAFGVFWGVLMLVILLGFGNGLEAGVTENMRGWGANAVFLWARRTSIPYQGMQPGREIRYDLADYAALVELPNAGVVAPRLQLGGWREGNNVSRGGETGNFGVMGDYPEILEIMPMLITEGRFLNPLDLSQRRKVAVIGEEVYKVLYQPGEPIAGTHIKVQGVYFQVVGRFRSRAEGERADRDAQMIYVPFSTFQQAFNAGDEVGWFSVGAAPGGSAVELERDVRALLSARHKIHPDDKNAIGSWNSAEDAQKIEVLFGGIRLFMWFVGIATLLAGAIGVSNIMLIAVKERTKEIGIRKALGATPRSIVSMIVQESVLLTSIAGYLGLVAGVGLLELVAFGVGDGKGPLGRPTVAFEVAIVAVLVLIVAGALAGLMPAWQAAKIQPVEALRAE